jgi:UDP-N-acetylmuramate--alanine ligase
MRVGHFPEAAAAADIVTWSPAVNAESDPDILASAPGARCSRRDLIGRIASEHRTLAVTGTHGKTTATSMLALIMDSARRKPSWLLGAPIRGLGDNGHYDGRDLVLELDESYGTFGVVTASALGIVNIDADHLDHYGTLENLEASFCEVAARTTGPVVFWRDGVRDGVAQQLIDGGALAISENVHDEWYVSDIVSTPMGSSWHLHTPNRELRLHLNVPGRHNVANASVAAALAVESGVSGDDIAAGLARFVGAPRRFEVQGRLEGALVVDDYAHLPREVEVTLAAARDAGCGRILAVFQPHRVTRTWATHRDFATSFALASEVVVSDIYTSGEANPEGLTGKLVADALTTPSSSHVHYIADLDALATWVRERATNYDAIIVMGAGDVNSIINHWELRS